MTDWVVDTNVAVVANGSGTNASVACQLASISFLHGLLGSPDRIAIDLGGEVLAEYKRYCSPSGMPGVGDRFFQEILRSHVDRVLIVDLPKQDDGSFRHFPNENDSLVGFDPSDRKFVSLALAASATVANSVDSDWLEALPALIQEGVSVYFVCGVDQTVWLLEPS